MCSISPYSWIPVSQPVHQDEVNSLYSNIHCIPQADTVVPAHLLLSSHWRALCRVVDLVLCLSLTASPVNLFTQCSVPFLLRSICPSAPSTSTMSCVGIPAEEPQPEQRTLSNGGEVLCLPSRYHDVFCSFYHVLTRAPVFVKEGVKLQHGSSVIFWKGQDPKIRVHFTHKQD